MKNVLLLGGTNETALIAERLKPFCRVTVSVFSSYGDIMLSEGVTVSKGPLEKVDIINMIKQKNIDCVIDATHPYAARISENGMAAAGTAAVPYFRYQRPKARYDNAMVFQNISDLIKKINQIEGNILITTGTKNLECWKKITEYKERVYLRVLPASSSIALCEQAGFSYKNIIALTGPFSVEMNRSIIRYTGAAGMVSKDGGTSGGTPEKAAACQQEEIPFLLLERPVIQYVNEYSDIESLIKMVLSYEQNGRRQQ